MTEQEGGGGPAVSGSGGAVDGEFAIWLPEGHLARLIDPSAGRWRDV